MWVRTSDSSSGSPARRTIRYLNTNTGTTVAAVEYLPGNGGSQLAGYYLTISNSPVFGPYATDVEAKAAADAALQPLYLDLP